MINIIAATTEKEFQIIDSLATIIWREHYTSIIGKAQVEYMLSKFQSTEAIADQIKQGYKYYTITFHDHAVGYISIKKENNTLFLSKVYVLSDYRGRKIGKTALQFVEDKARTFNLNSITLTVNKKNTNSITAYKRLGFNTVEDLVIDIGNGFVMDDFKMVKLLEV